MVKNNSNKGSALLITLIIMSIASVLIFSISKLSMFQQLRQGSYESSLGAYYAAEAGYNLALKAADGSSTDAPIELPNGAKYEYDRNDASDIISTGTFGKVKHQIIWDGTTKIIK
ncbi:MAG: pilus assembly PilX N-terminal domain-containing protein [Patescibacteria group bacterium]|jgi:hypothetical protein